jgi:hypothetical protein
MEFAEFFSAISFYYYFPAPPGSVELKWKSAENSLSWVTKDGDPLKWTTKAELSDQLSVKAISFQSPGWVDLAGIGTITREIRLLIQYLCERRARVNSLELDNEEKKLRIDAMKRLLDGDGFGVNPSKLPLLQMENSPLLDLIAQRKITGASEDDE